MYKPLHVQVAEALGCSPFFHDDRWYCEPERCHGQDVVRYPNKSHHATDYGALLDYDTDWSATGPLIERYGIELRNTPRNPEFWENDWEAAWPGATRLADAKFMFGISAAPPAISATGEEPLIAVCHLILALKAAEKLDAHQSSPLTASPPTA